MDPEDLDSWRIFFKTSGVDIFAIIDKAIMVAAKDYASHLRLRREHIVSLLYYQSLPSNQRKSSVPLEKTHCKNGCEGDGHQDKNMAVDDFNFNLSVERAKSFSVECDDENMEMHKDKPDNVEYQCNKSTEAVGYVGTNGGVEHQAVKQSVRNCCEGNGRQDKNRIEDDADFNLSVEQDKISMVECNYVNTEQILDKPTNVEENCSEEGTNLFQMCESASEQSGWWKGLLNLGDDPSTEVLKIKSIIEDCQNQSDKLLLELLMKLESMDLSFSILQATLIGKAVNGLRKHGTREIRKVSRSLICDWKAKADGWLRLHSEAEEIHPSAKDQCPPGLLIEGTTFAPLAPTLGDTLQAYESLDVEGFFSYPPDDALGNLYINEDLGFPEEEQLQKDTVSGKVVLSESIAEKDVQQQPLPLQEMSSNFLIEKQPSSDKNELAIDNGMQMEKNDCATNLGDKIPFQSMPKSYGNREGRSEEESVDMSLNVASNSQLKPSGCPIDRNASIPEQGTEKPSLSKPADNVGISQIIESQTVEGTARKPLKRSRKDEDAVKKQHATEILHVNNGRMNGEYKRHKHHHARTEK